MQYLSYQGALAGLMLSVAGAASAQEPDPVVHMTGDIGFPTVAAARASVSTRPGINASSRHRWQAYTDNTRQELWLFDLTGSGRPPVASRQIFNTKDGRLQVEVAARCEAALQICRPLLDEFVAMGLRFEAAANAPQGRAATGQTAANVERATPPERSGSRLIASFGYPTVAEARAALFGRSDMAFVESAGWLFAQDPVSQVFWNFSRETHPAHPVAVRRAFFGNGANVKIITSIHCEAAAALCDAIASEFRDQNRTLRARYRANYAASQLRQGYQPEVAQKNAARQRVAAFFEAVDAGRSDAAYAQLDAAIRNGTTAEEYAAILGRMPKPGDGDITRDAPIVSWYHDVPGQPAGTFAAYDFDGQSAGGTSFSETLILKEQADGSFTVQRYVYETSENPGPISIIGSH